MKGKYIGIIAFLSVIVLLIASCDLFAPDLVLQVVDPSYTITLTNNVEIKFKLKNTGSERLQNCKVKWYVDDTATGPTDEIEYDEITDWAPTFGVDLGVGATSSYIYAYTDDSTDFSGGVNFFGIYEMGWDYSSDE